MNISLIPTYLISNLNVVPQHRHHVKQCYKQSVLLAVPGAFIIACQLAPLAHYVIPYNWSWNYSFLFASVLCATDPVSVVDLLKRTRASSKLTTGIAGM